MPHRFFPGEPMHHDFWVFGVWQLIFWLLLLGAIALLIVWLVRNSHEHHHVTAMGTPLARSSAEPALHEARMRYARGEMTREQFAQISSDLGAPLPPAPPAATPPPPAAPPPPPQE